MDADTPLDPEVEKAIQDPRVEKAPKEVTNLRARIAVRRLEWEREHEIQQPASGETGPQPASGETGPQPERG